MRRPPALVLAALLVAGACSGGADRPGTATVEVLDGTVEVASAGEAFRRVDGSVRIVFGDRIRTDEDASARLRIGDTSGELGRLTEVWVESARPFLRSGGVLAHGGLPLKIGEGEVDTAGTVRVERGLSLRVGAYEGSATLSVGTRAVTADRFREVSAAPDFFPELTRPLHVSAADTWDRRLLGDELELERTIDTRLAGIAVQPPTIAAVFTDARPSLPATVFSVGLTDLELILAAVVAEATPGPFRTTVEEVVGLRGEGASWAVIAATLGTRTVDVIRAIDAALARASGPAAGPAPTPAPTPASTPAPSPPPGPTLAPPAPTPTPTPDCPGCGGVELVLCEVTGICTDVPVVP